MTEATDVCDEHDEHDEHEPGSDEPCSARELLRACGWDLQTLAGVDHLRWRCRRGPLERTTAAARFHQLERQRRQIEAQLAELVDEVEREGLHLEDGHHRVTTWGRALGRWSQAESLDRARVARLAHAAPEVGDALLHGTLGTAQAAVLGSAFANPRCGDQLPEALPRLLRHARMLSFDEFRRVVQRWEQIRDVDGAHRGHERSHRNRSASLTAFGDAVHLAASGGTGQGAEMIEVFERFCDAELQADLEQVRAERAAAGVPTADVANRRLPRTAAQRRFDALHQIFSQAASAPPDAVSPDPLLNIVVDAATFEQMVADAANGWAPDATTTSSPRTSPVPRGPDPRYWRCESTEGVPLDRRTVWRAAVLGHVRRIVVDSAGVAVDVGRRRRLFTGSQREAVMLLEGWCPVAGCTIPVRRCEADHTVGHAEGGDTATANGGPACRWHNLAKNRGFRVHRDAEGYWHTYRPDGSEIV